MAVSSAELPASVSVLIIGAGLAGLTAGRRLHAAGTEVLLLDKGRGVGGRCATRRFQDAVFDHGAQFFTVRDPAFQATVDQWQAEGLVREWSRGFSDGRGEAPDDGHPRYCATGGMNTIPKALAAGLNVHTSTRVTQVMRQSNAWSVRTECGNAIGARILVLTAPLPQSLALLPTENQSSLSAEYPTLRQVEYEPCFAVMLVLDGPSGLPAPGAVQVNGPVISWIADNTRKKLTNTKTALTIHTTRQFTEGHLEESLDKIAAAVIDAMRPWVAGPVADWQVHRWRYSKPLSFVGVPCVVAGTPPSLLLCGDCMQAPSRIEGAILSGMAAAQAILAI